MVTLVPDESLFSYSDLDQILLFILLAFISGSVIFTSTLQFFPEGSPKKSAPLLTGWRQYATANL